MKRCLLWGTGKVFKTYYSTIKYYEAIEEIEVVGITSKEIMYKSIMGFDFIDKSLIDVNSIDKVIVMANSSFYL